MGDESYHSQSVTVSVSDCTECTQCTVYTFTVSHCHTVLVTITMVSMEYGTLVTVYSNSVPCTATGYVYCVT